MNRRSTDYTHIVLLGGGHSHVEVLRQFGMRPDPNVRLTLIAKELHAPYSGMLPGYVAGRYSWHESHIDLRPLVRFADCRLVHAAAEGIDLDTRCVICADRPVVPFDVLSINVGSTPSMDDVPGAREFALPVKPVNRFLEAWNGVAARINDRPNDFRILTVGGGAGGVELTLNMQRFLHTLLDAKGARREGLRFRLITEARTILPRQNSGVQRRLKRLLDARGIELTTDSAVVEVLPDRVRCNTGDEVPYDALMWVTNAAPAKWIAESGLATDDTGFIATDENLRSTSHEFVFAAGDVATIVNNPRPKSGVFAVRQGPYLAENLRRVANRRPLNRFTPQKQFLSLIGTGDDYAVGSRGPWSFEGKWAWRLKEYIDRRWMRQYNELPEMSAPMSAAPAGGMRCAGCGAKVAGDALHRALARLEIAPVHGGVVGLDAPDDAAAFTPPAGQTVVQTVDFFPPLFDDAYTAGRIAAVHCLNDIYAMSATPAFALALATLQNDRADAIEQTLYELLAGAQRALQEDGAILAGGHTTEGPEMVFGLSVTGYADEARLWRKAGLCPGDRLILTKPLGTGVIFAADMRLKARGEWVENAVRHMLVSNRAAVDVFRAHGVVACTDVSGFGLAGHLREMLDASGVGTEIELAQLPVIDGAFECTAGGHRSSLHAANEAAVGQSLRADPEATRAPRYPLLFDPQTAGGLLAGVRSDRAEECVHALRDAGYHYAADVGVVTEGADASVSAKALVRLLPKGRRSTAETSAR